VAPIESIPLTLVAVILAWAAGTKLLAREDFGTWLAPYGIADPLRAPLALGLILTELAVAGLLFADVRGAPFAALGLGCLFVAALVSVRLRGVRRLRCGCFGGKERSTAFLLLRAFAFTGLAAIAAFGLPPLPNRDAAVVVALVFLSVAVAALAVLVLALYRQVGILTLRLGPGIALELEEEGPPVGAVAPALDGLARRGAELVAFFTADCRLCRELAPGVSALAREGLPVRIVYEGEDPDAFERWRVPGTPFAVHVVNGAVAAKGTVNNLEQLDGLIAVGSARADGAAA
jgi:hypothetical protein